LFCRDVYEKVLYNKVTLTLYVKDAGPTVGRTDRAPAAASILNTLSNKWIWWLAWCKWSIAL